MNKKPGPKTKKKPDRDVLSARRRGQARRASAIDAMRVNQGVSALEAALLFAEKYQLEPEEVAAAIRQNSRFKTLLARDAAALHLIKTD